jgi:uncharacterized membrane protein YdbT with pleckstrin-like domain
MYCTKCGAQNSDEARFCRKCGLELEPEEQETRVATRGPDAVHPDTERIFSVTPTVKFVYAGYAVAVLCAFVAALIAGAVLQLLSAGGTVLLGLVLCALFLVVPAIYHARQRIVRYTLTDTMIEIDRGLVSRSTQNIPLRRIQDVTVSATLLQRLLGFGDIVVDNASETGGKVVLDNIDSPRKYADLLLRQMRQLDR